MWPHARATLVALAMLVALADGCPIPARKHTAPSLRGPRDAVARARRAVMKPFRPVGELFVLRQQWKLFPTARHEQHLMTIEGRTRGERDWTLLYRPHDDDHAFRAEQIEYRRMRGPWNPGSSGPRNAYGPFAQWIAGRVFESYPAFDRVRVRHERIVIDPRAGRYEATGKYDYEKYERPAPAPRRLPE